MSTIQPLGLFRRLFRARAPQLNSPVPASEGDPPFEKRAEHQGDIQVAEHVNAAQPSNSSGEASSSALERLEEAAEHGNAEAQFHLGNRFHEASLSRSSPESDDDRIRAYVWFHLAARQGHRNAQASCDMVNLQMSDADLQEGNRRVRALDSKMMGDHAVRGEEG